MTREEQKAAMRICDHELAIIEKWADRVEHNLNHDLTYKSICARVTDVDESRQPVAWKTVHEILLDIDNYIQRHVTHKWEIVSNYSGEVVDLFGCPGQNAADAMRTQGYMPEVWTVYKTIY